MEIDTISYINEHVNSITLGKLYFFDYKDCCTIPVIRLDNKNWFIGLGIALKLNCCDIYYSSEFLPNYVKSCNIGKYKIPKEHSQKSYIFGFAEIDCPFTVTAQNFYKMERFITIINEDGVLDLVQHSEKPSKIKNDFFDWIHGLAHLTDGTVGGFSDLLDCSIARGYPLDELEYNLYSQPYVARDFFEDLEKYKGSMYGQLYNSYE
ncbi:MAG: hypothetical protein FWC47_06965 [Oscillospiraceae bacterium]|nr:hypothetical protein [Oscillospiraceae bacterium]